MDPALLNMPKPLQKAVQIFASFVLAISLTLLIFCVVSFSIQYSIPMIIISAFALSTGIALFCTLKKRIQNVNRTMAIIMIEAVVMFIIAGVYILLGIIFFTQISTTIYPSIDFLQTIALVLQLIEIILLIIEGILVLLVRKKLQQYRDSSNQAVYQMASVQALPGHPDLSSPAINNQQYIMPVNPWNPQHDMPNNPYVSTLGVVKNPQNNMHPNPYASSPGRNQQQNIPTYHF